MSKLISTFAGYAIAASPFWVSALVWYYTSFLIASATGILLLCAVVALVNWAEKEGIIK